MCFFGNYGFGSHLQELYQNEFLHYITDVTQNDGTCQFDPDSYRDEN